MEWIPHRVLWLLEHRCGAKNKVKSKVKGLSSVCKTSQVWPAIINSFKLLVINYDFGASVWPPIIIIQRWRRIFGRFWPLISFGSVIKSNLFPIILEALTQTIKLIITAPSWNALAHNFAVFFWDMDWKWRQSLQIANTMVNTQLFVNDPLIKDECLKNGLRWLC